MEDGAGVTAVSITGVSQARVGWLGAASAHSEGGKRSTGCSSTPRVIVKIYLSWAASPAICIVCGCSHGCVTYGADRVLAYADKWLTNNADKRLITLSECLGPV